MRSSYNVRRVLCGVFLLSMLAQSTLAQPQRGSLAGRVVDESGAPLPGVVVTLTGLGLFGQRIQITDATGEFRFARLPMAGPYEIECRLEGFTVVRRDVTVPGPGRNTSLEIQLPLAAVESHVTAEAPLTADESAAEPMPQMSAPPPSPSPPPRYPAEVPIYAAPAPEAVDAAAEVADEEERPGAEEGAEVNADEEQLPPADSESSPNRLGQTSEPLQEMLDEAEFAFNHPQRVDLDSEFYVVAAASFAGIEEDVLATLAEHGQVTIEDMELTTRVQVKLSSTKFDIVPITPEEQLVEPDSTTQWRWSLNARETGRHRLHLAVIAYKDSTALDLPKAIKTYERTIDVSVSAGRTSLGFVAAHWQFLTTAILIPLGTYFWQRKRRQA